jgi:hypothetical protein
MHAAIFFIFLLLVVRDSLYRPLYLFMIRSDNYSLDLVQEKGASSPAVATCHWFGSESVDALSVAVAHHSSIFVTCLPDIREIEHHDHWAR